MLIFIKGAGDLATGVAHRFWRCGFQVVMTETARPTTVRCTVAFSRAVYEGFAQVEGVTACLAKGPEELQRVLDAGGIAVAVDPRATLLPMLRPDAVIDAVIAKRNLGTKITDAPVVVALGPGFTAGVDCHAVVETKRGHDLVFTAGVDCHAVVETKRGHDLGRVILKGRAAENTGVPGEIGGYTSERIIRAGADGCFSPLARIGDLVERGAVVAEVSGVPARARISGVVRGMLPAGTPVQRGMKSGDIDPRGIADYCQTISDKARAIAGGALEAVLCLSKGRMK